MKTDAQLKKDVTTELEWDPSINASHVGVSAKDGVVTLTGHLDTFAEKYAVDRAVQRVAGVKAIALELDVKLDPTHKKNDSEIAAAIEAALKWHAFVPDDRIQVKVEKGWVTLQGEVDWNFQRRNAEKVVRPIMGVTGISNIITLKPRAALANVADHIRDALARYAKHEAKHIEVITDGTVVFLRGSVHSWAERSAAYGAAWSTPGVSKVIDELKIEP